MDDAGSQRVFEERFHAQLEAQAHKLLGRGLPADRVRIEPLPDGIETVRATLARHQRYDRGLVETLPGTRAAELRFTRRAFGLFPTTALRMRVQVLAPLDKLLQDEPVGPLGRDAVLDALARYELLPRRERPGLAVYASPTGFTPEARAAARAAREPAVVLLGGRADGGWDVDVPDGLRKTPWAKMFELETQDEKLRRMLYHLERRSGDLETRGVALPELAAALGVDEVQTERLVRAACHSDPRLMTVVHAGTTHISRSPLADEGSRMSLRSWIRKLLRLKPSVAEQVRTLTAQRVQLEAKRHELDERLDALEQQERDAVERGAAAKTDVERKQLAGKLIRTRRELSRVRAQAQMFTQQIDIVGTHIHNMTLAQQGRQIALPNAEQLAATAAEAEGMMAELSANADLAQSVEVGVSSALRDDEEAAILAEFQAAAQQTQTTTPENAGGERDSARAERPAAREVPPVPGEKSKARPETG